MSAWRRFLDALRFALGAPDYRRYLEHHRAHHPERAPLDAASFFRARQDARYGRRSTRCC